MSDPLHNLFSQLVYNPYATNHYSSLLGYDEAPAIVKQLVREFSSLKKVPMSRSQAIELAQRSFIDGKTVIKEWMVDEAYAIGAGGGCDFEWDLE